MNVTRGEAKQKAMSRDCSCVNGKDRDSNFNVVIDEVYDELETRTCEHCKYWNLDWVVYGICSAQVADFTLEKDDKNNITSKYFGCNKFERRCDDKSTTAK